MQRQCLQLSRRSGGLNFGPLSVRSPSGSVRWLRQAVTYAAICFVVWLTCTANVRHAFYLHTTRFLMTLCCPIPGSPSSQPVPLLGILACRYSHGGCTLCD